MFLPNNTHILFIHSLVDRHLDCFHIGAIRSNAAINIHVQVFVQTSFLFLLGIRPSRCGTEFHVTQCLHLWKCFPVVALLTFTPAMSEGSHPHQYMNALFYCNYSSRDEMLSRCGFNYQFIFDKSAKAIQWRKESISNKWGWNNWTSIGKKTEPWTKPHTWYKN